MLKYEVNFQDCFMEQSLCRGHRNFQRELLPAPVQNVPFLELSTEEAQHLSKERSHSPAAPGCSPLIAAVAVRAAKARGRWGDQEKVPLISLSGRIEIAGRTVSRALLSHLEGTTKKLGPKPCCQPLRRLTRNYPLVSLINLSQTASHRGRQSSVSQPGSQPRQARWRSSISNTKADFQWLLSQALPRHNSPRMPTIHPSCITFHAVVVIVVQLFIPLTDYMCCEGGSTFFSTPSCIARAHHRVWPGILLKQRFAN